MLRTVVALAILCVASPSAAQDQQPRDPRGWPCNGRPDATYFRTAEATGGQVFLFHPSEVAGSGMLMAAGSSHRQTLFRVAGSLDEGLHAFTFPVDASVDSLLVSVSLQCLQLVEVTRPSGALVQAADEATEYEQFEAGRVAVISAPQAGTWTVRVSGHGLFFLVVQAKSAVTMHAAVVRREMRDGHEALTPIYTPLRPGASELVSIALSGAAGTPRARIVSAVFDEIAPIPLRPSGSEDGEWLGEITVPGHGFRIVVNATDESGHPFQRVHAPLFQTTSDR